MSKNFSVDVNSFTAINDMDNIYAGATPTEPIKSVEPVEIAPKTEKIKTNSKNSDKIDHKKTNGTNKKDNYSITFKIDADIEDFLKNILWINRKTKNQYVNDLIRADMIKLLKLSDNASYEEIQKAWDKYKKANNI
jgi:hypothetical protein